MITKDELDSPENNPLFSGGSVIRGRMGTINNYSNISKYLKNTSYSFLDRIEVIQGEDEYPQGLCFTNDFILISSYSDASGVLGKIRVFDKRTGEYLVALGLDENSHLGGIAFDGKYIWVCNSSKMALERIEYSFLVQMVRENKGYVIDIRNLVEVYRVNNKPSCLTYFDGSLWVATHSVWTTSKMVGYVYNEAEDRLCEEEIYKIPAKVQGVTFTEQGEVYLSISYGRKNISYVKKYVSVYHMNENVNSYVDKMKLPPCSEGIVYDKKKLYVLFESAGKKFLEGTDGKGKSIAPIDKILVIENQ